MSEIKIYVAGSSKNKFLQLPDYYEKYFVDVTRMDPNSISKTFHINNYEQENQLCKTILSELK